jgi:hypothetical protein
MIKAISAIYLGWLKHQTGTLDDRWSGLTGYMARCLEAVIKARRV